MIASGPTLPDPTTCDDALAVLRRPTVLDVHTGAFGLKNYAMATAYDFMHDVAERIN